jgi:hypothetical protein
MNGLIKSPPEQPPLSNRNAYTTWPGGVDPTVPLYNTDNQKFGGGASARGAGQARRRRRNTRKTRKTRKSRRNNVNRKANRKARRASRRASRRSRRASRRSRRSRRSYRGGYATCAPIESGSPSIPMTASVCPEGYFEDKPVLIA